MKEMEKKTGSRRKSRKKTAAVLCCCGTLLLCACQKQSSPVPEVVQIGVTCYNQSDTFIGEMVESLKEQPNSRDRHDGEIVVTVRDAAGSQRTQTDQVEELIDLGCTVLCVNLVDRADPSEIIDLARENDVSIIFFNREPVSEDLLQWDGLYYVGADAKQSGQMQGELAAEVIRNHPQIDRNKDGKIQYVVLEGEPGHQDSIIRTENAVNTLKEEGISLEKLTYGIANWNRAQAQTRMMQMLSQNQNKIELVLANNDDMALGAIDAYEKLNLTESAWPVFFGIDGTDDGLRAVRDGKLAATVYNDKDGQARAMVDLALEIIRGREKDKDMWVGEKYTYVPYSKVTAENVRDYLLREK